MNHDLTTGNITAKLWLFALPLMFGNVLQQFYNLADTWIVGRYLGENALAAVGSAYTLMTFLTSILLGMCMGSSAFFAVEYGKRNSGNHGGKNSGRLNNAIFLSFAIIAGFTIVMNVLVLRKVDWIIRVLRVPEELRGMMREYLVYIFWGIAATFLYNYFANLLRAVGNSVVPLVFLAVSVVLNIGLDLLFVVVFDLGIAGAAQATVISQYCSGVGLMLFYYVRFPDLRVKREHMVWNGKTVGEIANLSGLTCLQQSVMNFGILMVQGLVNSFGATTMAAFAAAVKIDTVAYMPVQDYGNAFSTFVAQNYGAGKRDRIRAGIKSSLLCVFLFCLGVSGIVCGFAEPLMGLLVGSEKKQVVAVGVHYLRIEAAFYFGIGLLFMLYGYYRAVKRPGMSVVLTVISLGTRVLLAYTLSAVPAIGVTGIWAAIPIGWFLADLAGVLRYLQLEKKDSGRVLS